jgi:uncharacterized surface protein with fasciclin (FAS1) repeats
MSIAGAGVASLLLASAALAAPPAQDIVDTAVAAGSFKTLVAAVQAAGLGGHLAGPRPFYRICPHRRGLREAAPGAVEELLKPDNKAKLAAILNYHVNVEELTIKTSMGSVMTNDAAVVQTDIVYSNGVIHAIDAVLLPK